MTHRDQLQANWEHARRSEPLLLIWKEGGAAVGGRLIAE